LGNAQGFFSFEVGAGRAEIGRKYKRERAGKGGDQFHVHKLGDFWPRPSKQPNAAGGAAQR
jgi:hypothetical protein